VRGLNDRSRRDIVKSFVLSIKPMIVWLQETKLCSISAFDILSILGAGYNNFVYTPAHGTRGGILVACRDGVYSSIGSLVRDFSVSVKLQEDVVLSGGGSRVFMGHTKIISSNPFSKS
jgi:exonuclease III